MAIRDPENPVIDMTVAVILAVLFVILVAFLLPWAQEFFTAIDNPLQL